ncbi:MAG: hypothetical protein ACKVOH_02485 [Chlamydiales bacterium]
MQIGILGINHKSADLALRDKLAKVCAARFCPGNLFYTDFSYIALSTCNRTEIYFSSQELAETHNVLIHILRQEISDEFEHTLYSYFGIDTFFHLARVTAGLDSAILGETEIQGQVKQAYEVAREYKMLSFELHFLFQKCLKIGKEARTKMDLGRGLPTLEDTIFHLGQQKQGPLFEKNILFVGLSKINHKIYHRFCKKGIKEITFTNRTEEKLHSLPTQKLPWGQLHKWEEFDLVIFGTKSPQYLVESCKRKPLIFDLSVPRNVHPELGNATELINIDELNREIEGRRKQKVAQVSEINNAFIWSSVRRQLTLFRSRLLPTAKRRVSS